VRAFGKAADGAPDAEAHTNPVYVHVDGRAPYDRESLDVLVARLDGQMDRLRAREFPEKGKMLDHFQGARDILLKIREAGGIPPGGARGGGAGGARRGGLRPEKEAPPGRRAGGFPKAGPAEVAGRGARDVRVGGRVPPRARRDRADGPEPGRGGVRRGRE